MPNDTSAPADAPSQATASTATPEPANVPAPEAGASVVSNVSGSTLPETGKSGGFIESALSALRNAEAEEQAPSPAPAKVAEPAKQAEPAAKPAAETDPEEDAKAEADIKREASNMSPQHRAAFTKLRYEARDLKRQLKAAQAAQTQAAETGTTTDKVEANAEVDRLRSEYDAMKAKVENYEKEMYSVRLEATELFQNEVAAPRHSVATNISQIAERYEGLDSEAVIAAVRSGDPEKVSSVTADMSEFDRYRFYNLVDQYQKINAREESLRQDAKGSLENYARTRREAEEAKRAEEKAQWEKSLGDVWDELAENYPILADDGDEEWSAAIGKVKGFASPDRFDKLTVRERAEALYRAAAFPVVAAELEAVVSELKAAQDKLSKYDGATPGVSASGGGSEPSPFGSATGEGAFVENALSALRKVGAR